MTQILLHDRRRFASGAASSIAVSWPSGYTAVANDVALVHLTQLTNNAAVTTPANWQLLLRTQRTTTHVDFVYRRRLSAGAPPSTNFVSSGSNDFYLTVSIWKNVDTTTSEDVATVSSTSGTASTFTGPESAITVTPAAAVVSFVSSNSATASDWIQVYDAGVNNQSTVPFHGYDVAPYSPQACAYHYQTLENSEQLSRQHDFRQIGTAGGWIGTQVVLRPADPTEMPIPRNLTGAARQQPLRTFGVRVAELDTIHQVRFSVQVLNPVDNGGSFWAVDENDTAGGLWDLAEWGGPGRWQDITDRVFGCSWTDGTDTPGDRPRVAVSTVELDNADGALSPWATTGDFTNGGESWFTPGLLVRGGVTYLGSGGDPLSGEALWLADFTGLIESIDEDTTQGVTGRVVVTLVHPISRLATFNGLEQLEKGGGESAATRLVRLLTDANWEYGEYQGTVPTVFGTATMQGTVLAGERLAELYLTGDSAGTYVYGYPDGAVIWNIPAVSASPLEVSNDPAGSELPIPVDGIKPYADTSRILNTAIGAFAGGSEQSVADALSVAKFGRIDSGNGWPRRDLICQSEASVVSILEDVIAARANDSTGIASVVMDCDMDPTLWYWRIAAMRLFANVTVRWVHPSGSELTQAGYVEGLTHNVTNPGGGQFKWTATLSLARFVS